jgi:hypothetical protein
MRRCAFYVVADAAHYAGAAAALNSLRLVGHDSRAFVLDAGLTEAQRSSLGRTAEIVPGPDGVSPRLAKWAAPLAHPSDVMVLVDADLIVTRSLDPLLEQAARGSVVAFADDHPTRFDDRWADYVGVSRLHRRTYVNAGFVVLPSPLGIDVLTQLRNVQLEIGGVDQTWFRDDDRSGVFAFPDQDSWNAILSATVDDGALSVWPHELAPFPREHPRVVDAATLRCRVVGGERPYLVHHIGPKPWLVGSPPNAYTKLLPRVLLSDDVVVRLDPAELPISLRPGLRGVARRLRSRLGLAAHRLARRRREASGRR